MTGDPAGGAEPPRMTMLGLVDEFRTAHFQMPGCKFCFVLGAGASVTSGIKSAGTMVGEWVKTIYRQTVGHTGEPPAGWASDANLGITGFDRANPAASYSALYHRMYARKPGAGYAYLEAQMEKAEPSFGYAVLGRLLAETRHGLVITVNFDNLVADSVSLFTKTYPMVCGHELLLPFMTAQVGRPRVLKVHRDLLLGPKSLPGELATIDEGLSDTIGRLLTEYTPIVIGYGGNDGSLMGCLEGLKEPLKNGLFWCYRDELPPPRIRELVARHNGYLVPIVGFDELLMQFGDVLEYPIPHQYILDRAKERADRIVKQAQELAERIKDHDAAVLAAATAPAPVAAADDTGGGGAVGAAMSSTMLRAEDGGKRWWHWCAEAEAEPDVARRDRIYQRAIKVLPHSPEMLGSYARFLTDQRKTADAARAMYERAVAADPTRAITLGNYAVFLTDVLKDYRAAGVMHEAAINADRGNSHILSNYADFLLSTGRVPEGLDRLDQAFATIADRNYDDRLLAVCWMYAYCCRPAERHAEALGQLKTIVTTTAVRTNDWDFSGVVARAVTLKHPEAKWLPKLAEVVAGRAEPATLKTWKAWKAAPAADATPPG